MNEESNTKEFSFAHLADCHIGSWSNPLLKELSIKAFEKSIEIIIRENVDFVVISGDLFNTPLPGIEAFERTISALNSLNKNDIPVYVIAGSHDFSASNKTFLRILSSVELIKNATQTETTEKENDDQKVKLKIIIDQKTQAKITGILGKRNALDSEIYKYLDRESIEKENGFKIFMFHNAIDELKTKEFSQVKGISLSLLPKNFNYYAGGHIHYVFQQDLENYGRIVFPGPLFPTSFEELERFHQTGFFINKVKEKNNNYDLETRRINLTLKNIRNFKINCNTKTGSEIKEEILEKIKNEEFFDTIVLLRFFGTMQGRINEIDFKEITKEIEQRSPYLILRNTSQLRTPDFKETYVKKESPEQIEQEIIEANLGKLIDNSKEIKGILKTDEFKSINENTCETNKNQKEIEREFIKILMKILDTEKIEGEKQKDFETRLRDEFINLFDF